MKRHARIQGKPGKSVRSGGCTCEGELHTRFVHFWQRWTARVLCVEVTYFHGDDMRESRREWCLEVPRWAWRPVCWLKGHSEGPDEACIICGKATA